MTMFNLVTEMMTKVPDILTKNFTLQQFIDGGDDDDDDVSARMARAFELVQLAAEVYRAIDAYSNLL